MPTNSPDQNQVTAWILALSTSDRFLCDLQRIVRRDGIQALGIAQYSALVRNYLVTVIGSGIPNGVYCTSRPGGGVAYQFQVYTPQSGSLEGRQIVRMLQDGIWRGIAFTNHQEDPYTHSIWDSYREGRFFNLNFNAMLRDMLVYLRSSSLFRGDTSHRAGNGYRRIPVGSATLHYMLTCNSCNVSRAVHQSCSRRNISGHRLAVNYSRDVLVCMQREAQENETIARAVSAAAEATAAFPPEAPPVQAEPATLMSQINSELIL